MSLAESAVSFWRILSGSKIAFSQNSSRKSLSSERRSSTSETVKVGCIDNDMHGKIEKRFCLTRRYRIQGMLWLHYASHTGVQNRIFALSITITRQK